MDMNNVNIEEIVKQVLSGMTGNAPAQTAAPAAQAPAAPTADPVIPKTAHVAMLTALEHYEIKEFPMPEVGDDDILVKVEGCGVCGTDAHEFKRDPFGLIPVALGHEGTGEIVKMGKNVTKDSAGKPLNIGDKVVTCMIFKDDPDITMFDLNKQNVGGADVYGLLPDDDIHLNGWFSDYILVRGGSTIFNVSDLDLDSRILIEPCAVLVHAVERAKTTGILRFNSRVVVQGCGPIGLICIAVLKTLGIQNIVAVDGEQKRLGFAKEMGAGATVNFKDYKGIEALAGAVKDAFGGYLAETIEIPQIIGNILNLLMEETINQEQIIEQAYWLIFYCVIVYIPRTLYRTLYFTTSRKSDTYLRKEVIKNLQKVKPEYFEKENKGVFLAYLTKELLSISPVNPTVMHLQYLLFVL